MVVRGDRTYHAEPSFRTDVTADLLDLLVGEGDTTGQHQGAISRQVVQLVVVDDLEADAILDQCLFDAVS